MDVVLLSGFKELGVGKGACLAARKTFLAKLSQRIKERILQQLKDEARPTVDAEQEARKRSTIDIEKLSSTVDTTNIVALGMALGMLRSGQNLFRLEANFDGDRRTPKTFEEQTCEHMNRLTHAMIEMVEGFGRYFLYEYIADRRHDAVEKKLEGLHKPTYLSNFGGRVIDPVHRRLSDLAGIVTTLWPFMEGRDLSERLGRQGFPSVHCRYQDRCVRFSAGYDHELEDIDGLRRAIAEVFWGALVTIVETEAHTGQPQTLRNVQGLHDRDNRSARMN